MVKIRPLEKAKKGAKRVVKTLKKKGSKAGKKVKKKVVKAVFEVELRSPKTIRKYLDDYKSQWLQVHIDYEKLAHQLRRHKKTYDVFVPYEKELEAEICLKRLETQLRILTARIQTLKWILLEGSIPEEGGKIR